MAAIRPMTTYTYNTLGDFVPIAAGRTDSSGTYAAADVVTPQVSYLHDEFGRKIRDTDALGETKSLLHDLNDNVTSSTEAEGQVTAYAWAYGHQLLRKTNFGATSS